MDHHYTLAGPPDVDAVLAMMREYYTYDRLTFRPELARAAVVRMIDDPSLGSLWLIRRGEDVLGYMVLAFSYSLEFGGRIAFLDEFFLRPHHRRRGIGRHALIFLEGVCRPLGVKAIRLEVERQNVPARTLYERVGFVAHDRNLMSRSLVAR